MDYFWTKGQGIVIDVKTKVAIAGASGYAGGEVLRILCDHPEVEIGALTAAASAGTMIQEHHPHLRPLAERVLVDTTVENLAGHDVVFIGLPHGASGELSNALAAIDNPPLILDLGADHRLTDPAAWQEFYGSEYAGAWDYGLPELLYASETSASKQREILRKSRAIAVPGCNVIAVTLALAPGVRSKHVDPGDIVANLAVGYSGAGKALKPHLLASQGLGNAFGYSIAGKHRHIPEIEQNLLVAGATEAKVSFTPVLVPMSRGILATVTAPLVGSGKNLRQAWEQAYQNEKVVTLLPEGTWPTIAMVVGSGAAAVQVAIDERAGKVVAQCAIDNLGKGTASSAVQAMNLALGLPETTAISVIGVAP